LPLPLSDSVLRAIAGSHGDEAPDESPETRHHESAYRRCMRCDAS
jgi:hypothetical protein